MQFPRRSGILLHPTSLPGPFGIGDFGPEAYKFVDFLKESGQTYWQILPLSPTGYGDSPYQSPSAFAGNPMLISPEKLIESCYLTQENIHDLPPLPQDHINFSQVIRYKQDLLNIAFKNFRHHASQSDKARFSTFREQQAFWLDDFALYMTIKKSHDLAPWFEWAQEEIFRQPDRLADIRNSQSEAIQFEKFLQWTFFEQWWSLKEYANAQGIQIFGDLPIFISMDSADVWANPYLFYFDHELKPIAVSGVPPDSFSDTGQLWGHPLYRWDKMAKEGYSWWISRFKMTLTQVDLVRIDHFRGLYNYWEIPAGEETAVHGHWIKGPGANFLHAITEALGDVPIIAEDLGEFDQESRAGVDALLREFNYPGMKILQFAFGAGTENHFLPHNFTTNWVVYTGTHDNDTTVGWFNQNSTQAEREYALQYMRSDGSDISWDLIRLAWGSVAHTAITPAQDLLSLGQSARMNTPSTSGPPNWCWRLPPDTLTSRIAARIRALTSLYGRLP
jgi:4-alpha-glucanotransferase